MSSNCSNDAAGCGPGSAVNYRSLGKAFPQNVLINRSRARAVGPLVFNTGRVTLVCGNHCPPLQGLTPYSRDAQPPAAQALTRLRKLQTAAGHETVVPTTSPQDSGMHAQGLPGAGASLPLMGLPLHNGRMAGLNAMACSSSWGVPLPITTTNMGMASLSLS